MKERRKELISGPAHRRLSRASLILALCVAFCILSACTSFSLVGPGRRRVAGSGVVTNSTSTPADFRAVELQFQGDLLVSTGNKARLTIEAEENLLPYLEDSVVDGTLIIRKTPSHVTLKPTAPIRYYLTVTGLESLTTTSSGSIRAPVLEADRFWIATKSSGSVSVDALYAAHLEVSVQAAGGVTIAGGRVGEQWITLTSEGGYESRELVSSRARVRLSSSGEARVSVRDRLEADLSSSGNLYSFGSPSVLVQEASAEGRVVRVHE